MFAGLVGGVVALVDALVGEPGRRGVELRLGPPSARARVGASDGLPADVSVRPGAASRSTPTRCVLAAPAGASRPAAGRAGRSARASSPRCPYASIAVVTLVVRGAAHRRAPACWCRPGSCRRSRR